MSLLIVKLCGDIFDFVVSSVEEVFALHENGNISANKQRKKKNFLLDIFFYYSLKLPLIYFL